MNLSKAFATGAIAATCALAQENVQAADQGNTQPVAQSASKAVNADKIGFGLHGDFEYGFLYGLEQDWNGGDETDAPSGIGLDVGVRGRIPMTNFLQFNPEVNFHYISLTQSDEGTKSRFTQMDIEVPLAVRAFVIDIFYVSAGIQANLNIYSDASLETEDAIDVENGIFVDVDDLLDIDVENSAFTLGLVFGVGVNIMDRLTFDARLVLGVTDAYVESDDAESSWLVLDGSKLMSFKFGVGFWIL